MSASNAHQPNQSRLTGGNWLHTKLPSIIPAQGRTPLTITSEDISRYAELVSLVSQRKQGGTRIGFLFGASGAQCEQFERSTFCWVSSVARMADVDWCADGVRPSKLSALDRKHEGIPKSGLMKMVKLVKEQQPTNGWLVFGSNVGTGEPISATRHHSVLGPDGISSGRVYPLSQKDTNGNDYSGAEHKYVLHFDEGQFPPVKGFWSPTCMTRTISWLLIL